MREEIYQMINRWFDKGVDGFRMDVVTIFAKAPGLPDGGSGAAEGYVFSPEYFAFQPKLHDYLREMRQNCFAGRDCMCVGETSFVNTQNANTVVGDGQELDLLFQFDIMDMDGADSKWDVIPFDLSRFKKIIADWQAAIDWNTLFWGNHDQPRVVSRFGSTVSEELRVQSGKMLATAMYLLKGTPFLFQGEEIGMTNAPFEDASQLRDIESINLLMTAEREGRTAWARNGIRQKGRDNSRTPMQWNGGLNAGFSSGTPWIMVNPNYLEINVADAMADDNSILNYYRRLIALRNNSETLQYGSFTLLLENHPQLFVYERTLTDDTIIIVCNFSDRTAEYPADLEGEILLSNFEKTACDSIVPYGTVVVRKSQT